MPSGMLDVTGMPSPQPAAKSFRWLCRRQMLPAPSTWVMLLTVRYKMCSFAPDACRVFSRSGYLAPITLVLLRRPLSKDDCSRRKSSLVTISVVTHWSSGSGLGRISMKRGFLGSCVISVRVVIGNACGLRSTHNVPVPSGWHFCDFFKRGSFAAVSDL